MFFGGVGGGDAARVGRALALFETVSAQVALGGKTLSNAARVGASGETLQ